MPVKKTPEPKYLVIKKDQAIEIRQYPLLVVAEVRIEGERYAAIQEGFRVLADYIFGNNQGEKTIAMTAPVMQQGTKIAMTAPVSQTKDLNSWIVRFVMPEKFTLQTLPLPNNTKIALLEIPAHEYVVICFSGLNTQRNLNQHELVLRDYLKAHHLKVKGDPIYAFYNPPWILPFLRRNEIMLALA